jgi:ornithine cyclodeaminase/alanine dehydrogenase-like protein (mu-crystallin family)
MHVIDRSMIEDLLDYPSCIAAMDSAMRAVSDKDVVLPLRFAMQLPDSAGIMGVMPGCAPSISRMGIKVVNILPANRQQSRPSHTGSFLLFDQQTGEALAVLDAAELTVRRTAAASALATRELARTNCRNLTILGCGDLALHHINAIACVAPIETVTLWNRSPSVAEKLAIHLKKQDAATIQDICVATTIAEALASADIVCTLTGSPTPILDSSLLRPGMHINAVGSSDASKHEIDPACLNVSQYFVDYRASAAAQAGELIERLNSGASFDELVAGEIGDVLNNRCTGRADDSSITIFRSLGVAAQDIYAADLVLERLIHPNRYCG